MFILNFSVFHWIVVSMCALLHDFASFAIACAASTGRKAEPCSREVVRVSGESANPNSGQNILPRATLGASRVFFASPLL